ncbi:hypothetical protein TNCV_2759111 [Trichonephila clavipes]|nr:hypothetical protein TNCV_2759111 [Trichonephila clavipes]
MWEAPINSRVFSFKIGVEPSKKKNRTVTYMGLKATANRAFAMMNFVSLDLAHADQAQTPHVGMLGNLGEASMGECATADEGAAKIFPEELAKIIENGDYSANQVFNADETGLYWKKLPNRTYIAKDEKSATGHKASKD